MSISSQTDPMVGRVLDGRYELLSRLARGGMATVYRAQDRRLQRTVAVKVMHDGLGDDAEFARKFDREARSAATLSNPHVVSVFDQGIDDGRPYIVMEFVQGCTLRHIISREAPIAPLKALEVMEYVASALSSAHEAGLVHRDVKPENVLISDRSQIKVADFGLARAVSNQTATATQGLLIGTVSYLPPELVTTGRADARSDVYSAGVVLFELLTGRKPHTGETPIQVAYSHVHNDIPAPSTLLVNDPRATDSRRIIPPYLDALVVACTRREPGERPKDGRALLHLLRVAKKALGHGILDDPALTGEMNASVVRGQQEQAARAAARPSHADEPTTIVQHRPAPAGATAPGTGSTAQQAGAGQQAASFRAAPPQPPSPHSVQQAPPRNSQPAPPRIAPAATARTVQAAPPRPQQGVPRRVVHTAPRPGARPAYDPRAEHRRRVARRRRGVLAVLVTLVLAAALALGAYWWFASGRYEATPNLTRLPQTQATQLARATGLALVVHQEFSDSVAKGRVIRTAPAAGAKVLKDGSVEAWVSRGPEVHVMPSVENMTQDQASRAITAAGLTVGDVSQGWSETVPQGIVSRVSQPAGTVLKRGTAIDLVVSRGRRPITVSDWTGKDASQARQAMTADGLSVQESTQASDTVPKGQVISQAPATATAHLGDVVQLVVSKGSDTVAVPDVKGMTEKDASDALTKAGFTVQVNHATPSWLRADAVEAVDPGVGSRVKRGSSVTIWVV